MATYEEMFGPDGKELVRTRTLGGFQFPGKPPGGRVSAPSAGASPAPARAELVFDVLRPSAPEAPVRRVAPQPIEKGSFQEQLIEQAATALRTIRIEGRTRVPYDPDNPEPFWEACAETAKTALDVEATLEDPQDAAIAAAIFKGAGFFDGGIKLLTVRAQVEAQMFVIERTRQVRFLFAKQQRLDALGERPSVG